MVPSTGKARRLGVGLNLAPQPGDLNVHGPASDVGGVSGQLQPVDGGVG